MSRRPQLAREEPVDEPVATPDGTERVLLRFLPDGTEVRVPSGTPIFDAASWNGIAIDSTCGGHGTCRKCKVQVLHGDAPISPLDPRAFSTQELHDGWRLACRAPAREDLVVNVPPLQTRPKAALAGVGRHVILRPAVQKRYVELDEPTLEDQRSDVQRLLDAIDDLEPRVGLDVVRKLGGVLRAAHFKVTAVIVDEELIDVEPGDTTARDATRWPSTSARRRSSARCSTSRPASRSPSRRCSTASSPSAATSSRASRRRCSTPTRSASCARARRRRCTTSPPRPAPRAASRPRRSTRSPSAAT